MIDQFGVIDENTIRAWASNLPNLSPLQPVGSWARHRYELRRHMREEELCNFLNWSTIQATMFVGENHYTRRELDRLMKSPLMPRYRLALQESDVGHPTRMSGAIYTSGNLVHQVTHLSMFEQTTGLMIDEASVIVEFGGGYGCMSAVARRLGFTGEYWLIDLPEVALLQAYYLSNLGYPSLHIQMTDEVPETLPENVDVFIGLYSFSEVPVYMREELFEKANPQACLFAYQPDWGGVDNNEYFAEFALRKAAYRWTKIANPFLDSHSYLIGVK